MRKRREMKVFLFGGTRQTGSITPPPPSPPAAASLVAQWSADNIVGLNNNDPVSTWPDSINGANGTQSGTKRPIYKLNVINGKPAVQFDGITQLLQVGTPAALVAAVDSQVYSVFVIYKDAADSGTGFGAPIAAAAGGGFFYNANGTVAQRYNGNNQFAAPSGGTGFHTMATTSVKPYTNATGTTGMERFYVDGSCVRSDTSSAAPGTGGNAFAIGGLSVEVFQYKGQILDIFIWSVELTFIQYLQMVKFACDKYAQPYPWLGKTNVCYNGDSLTGCTGATSVGTTYPYISAQNLGLSYGQWHNWGLGGQSMDDMISRAPMDAYAISGFTGMKTIQVMDEWFNQKTTAYNSGIVFAPLIRAIANNFVVVPTSTSYSGDPDANRVTYNTNWATNHATYTDDYAAVHLNASIGTTTAYSLNSGTLWSDTVHLNDAGYAIKESVITPAISPLM